MLAKEKESSKEKRGSKKNRVGEKKGDLTPKHL